MPRTILHGLLQPIMAWGGTKQFEFGVSVAGKETNAGKIGYQFVTSDAMDIFGAGTLSTNRKIKFWSEGGATFTGNVGIGLPSSTYLLHLYSPTDPRIRITNDLASLEIGVASCNGCMNTFSVAGNSVIRHMGGAPKRVIFSTATSVGTGASYDFNSESHQIMRVSDGNYVSIGTLTLPASSPTGGYRFGVSGNVSLNGKVVIGDPATITTGVPFPSGYNLYVTDGILATKVKVSLKTTADWSDFVFAPEYKLMPLDSVEAFIKEHKHLPDVPSAEEAVSGGIDVAKMDATLLQKIEELTLYMIELKKENAGLREEIKAIKIKQE